MIIYIATHGNNKLICEAVEESNKEILNGIVDAKFELSSFIKTELPKLSIADTIIIDLSVLSDKEEDIVETLNSFKIVSEKTKIIIIAPYKHEGDNILSEIVSLAIYNIVVFDEESDYEEVKSDLVYCLSEGKKYKDSIKYKVSHKQPTKEVIREKAKTVIKEKVIVKKEIRQTVSKAIIGFMGAQHRIGTTHNCIVSAMFLKKLGYSVALVERNNNMTKSLANIKENYEMDIEENNSEGYFTYKGIDFYPDYDFKENYRLQAKNYNFIIEDFGTYESEKDLKELDRCVLQIIVGGFKSWEADFFNKIFSDAGESRLKQYHYLFSFTSKQSEKEVKECMEGLSHVYLAGYTPDPFCESDDAIKSLFKEYVPEVQTERNGITDNLIDKFRAIKERVGMRGLQRKDEKEE